MKRADIIFGLISLFLCVLMFVFTQRFVGRTYTGYGPDQFPRFLAVVWSILSIVLILNALRGKFIQGKMEITWVELRVLSSILAITIATLILMQYLGYLFSMIIYTFVVMTYLEERNMIAKICLSIGVATGLYLLFHHVLVIPLPEFQLFQF